MTSNTPDVSSMDQVREILMGSQLKDMDNRLQRQEERFTRELADLADSIKNRVESLENFMKSEAVSLLHRVHEEQAERAATIKNEQRERQESLKTEQRERDEALQKDRKDREDAIAQLTREFAQKEDALERKLAALSSSVGTAEQELRKLMLAESVRLSDKIEEKYKETLNLLSRINAELRDDLVSRSALSSLFTENAVKLVGEISPNLSPEPPVESGKKGNKSGASES